jgi:signal transduction histidine kinase
VQLTSVPLFAHRAQIEIIGRPVDARRCAIGLRHSEGTLRAWVTDDGVGGAALDKGHGLRGLDDRLHAAGGRLRVTSPYGGPTTITAELPCG